jgi:hypothetical protein
MPANLTPEYRAAEEAFRKARDPQERLDGPRDSERGPFPQISTNPKAQGGTMALDGLDVARTESRGRVREAALRALAAGKVTPAFVKALVSLLASAAQDEARVLEEQLEKAVAVIEDLRARLERKH